MAVTSIVFSDQITKQGHVESTEKECIHNVYNAPLSAKASDIKIFETSPRELPCNQKYVLLFCTM